MEKGGYEAFQKGCEPLFSTLKNGYKMHTFAASKNKRVATLISWLRLTVLTQLNRLTQLTFLTNWIS